VGLAASPATATATAAAAAPAVALGLLVVLDVGIDQQIHRFDPGWNWGASLRAIFGGFIVGVTFHLSRARARRPIDLVLFRFGPTPIDGFVSWSRLTVPIARAGVMTAANLVDLEIVFVVIIECRSALHGFDDGSIEFPCCWRLSVATPTAPPTSPPPRAGSRGFLIRFVRCPSRFDDRGLFARQVGLQVRVEINVLASRLTRSAPLGPSASRFCVGPSTPAWFSIGGQAIGSRAGGRSALGTCTLGTRTLGAWAGRFVTHSLTSAASTSPTTTGGGWLGFRFRFGFRFDVQSHFVDFIQLESVVVSLQQVGIIPANQFDAGFEARGIVQVLYVLIVPRNTAFRTAMAAFARLRFVPRPLASFARSTAPAFIHRLDSMRTMWLRIARFSSTAFRNLTLSVRPIGNRFRIQIQGRTC
jgi:hypothetical protein